VVEVEVEGEQDLAFHSFEFGGRVAAVCDLDVVLHARGVDFLVLAGDPQTGCPHELVVVLGDVHQ